MRYSVQMFQQNSYRTERYNRWLRSTGEWHSHMNIVSILAAVVFAFTNHIAALAVMGVWMMIIAVSEFCYSGWFVRSFDLMPPFRKVVKVEVDGVELIKNEYTVDGRTLLISSEVSGENLVVSYEAGLSQVPFDMKAAILLTAAKLFNNPVDSVESLPSVAKKRLSMLTVSSAFFQRFNM